MIGRKLAPRAELTDVGLYGIMQRYGDLAIHAVLDLRRTFSREQIEGALRATIADFPVLGHRYQPGFWRDRWVPVTEAISGSVRVLEGGDVDGETARWLRTPVDVTRSRPIRIVGIRTGRGMRIVLTLMHLAVDGAGIAAVGHVLAARLCGVEPSLPVDARRDFWRLLEGLRWHHWLGVPPALLRSLARPFEQWSAGRRRRAFPSDGRGEPVWREMVIAPHELEAVTGRLREKPTVNDLLVGALARAGAERSDDGPVVVLYTMDLRRYRNEPGLFAANGSSVLSAVIDRAHTGSLAAAVREAARSTARERAGLSGPAFVLGPFLLAAGLPHRVTRKIARLLAPALVDMPLARGFMLTNVGRIDAGLLAFGEDLEQVRIVGPHVDRFPVPVIVAFGFRGQLCLQIYGPRGVGVEALAELERDIRRALDLEPQAAERGGRRSPRLDELGEGG